MINKSVATAKENKLVIINSSHWLSPIINPLMLQNNKEGWAEQCKEYAWCRERDAYKYLQGERGAWAMWAARHGAHK